VWTLSTSLLSLALIAAMMSGCGDSTGAGSATNQQGSDSASKPTREFVIPGGDNTIQYYGREGSRTEREEASKVVVAWDKARANRDWPMDCRLLSRSYIDTVVTDAKTTSKGKATNCVQALTFFGAIASGGSSATTSGPIDSLRVSHGIGYAQYHGRKHVDWIVPLEREGNEWKVGVTAPVNRRQ
jgi:hypothetical protein